MSELAATIRKTELRLNSPKIDDREKTILEKELDKERNAFPKKSRFLYEKQNAQPGMQPHEACKKILTDASETNEELLSFLRAVEFPNSEDPKELRNYIDVLAMFAFEARKTTPLTNMGYLVERHISDGRQKIAKNICTWMIDEKFGIDEEEADSNNSHFIVTFGYSKTVREAIVALLSHPNLKEKVSVFVISDTTKDDDDADARRMVSELNLLSDGERVGLGQGEVLASTCPEYRFFANDEA